MLLLCNGLERISKIIEVTCGSTAFTTICTYNNTQDTVFTDVELEKLGFNS